MSMTTSSDNHSRHSTNGSMSLHMCVRCHNCALCNCRECQLRLSVEYCSTCRCYWRPAHCNVCGVLTGYTQTCYPSLHGCTKTSSTPTRDCTPPTYPVPTCPVPSCSTPPTYRSPPTCSCVTTYPPVFSPPACNCVQSVPKPCVASTRTGHTQTCCQPPVCTACPTPTPTTGTYCVICHKFV